MSNENEAKVESPVTPLIPKLKLVLNGGSDIMDSATVPFRVGFSDEVLAKKPTHILLVDETENDLQGSYRGFYGEREVYSLANDLLIFRVSRPGKHRISVFAFPWGDEEAVRIDRFCGDLLCRDSFSGGVRRYLTPIVTDADRSTCEHLNQVFFRRHCIADETVEINVPDQVFAKPAETGIGKLLWRYANWLWGKRPVDECDHRRRVIGGLLLSPIVLLVSALATVFYSVYLVLAAGIVFLFGYRPTNIFKQWFVSADSLHLDWEVREFPNKPLKWSETWDEKVKMNRYKYMPFRPIVPLIVIGAAVGIAYWLAVWFAIPWIFVLLGFVSAFVFGALLVKLIVWAKDKQDYSKKAVNAERAREREDRRKRLEQEREEEAKKSEELIYVSFLQTNFTLGAVPTVAKIKEMPHKPDGWSGRTVHWFRTSYHDLKGRICRPYAS